MSYLAVLARTPNLHKVQNIAAARGLYLKRITFTKIVDNVLDAGQIRLT